MRHGARHAHFMNAKTFFTLLAGFTFSWPAWSAELKGTVSAAGSDRRIAGAIVYVVAGIEPGTNPAQQESRTWTVRNGALDPQVLVVPAGQSFTLKNAGEVLYNVHFRFRQNKERNVALVNKGQASIKTERPELFARVSEDLGRLNGYVCVMENGFHALTGPDGTFQLSGLPAGTYTMEAAHPREGRLKRQITIGNAGATSDFALPGMTARKP
jgi:hypothetical protein